LPGTAAEHAAITPKMEGLTVRAPDGRSDRRDPLIIDSRLCRDPNKELFAEWIEEYSAHAAWHPC
jgi:hypothetical protein